MWLKVNCLFVVDHFLLLNIWYVKMGERFKLICGFSAFADRLSCLGTCVCVRVLCVSVSICLCVLYVGGFIYISQKRRKRILKE